MHDAVADQAAGLRRLLAPPTLRSAAITATATPAACGEVIRFDSPLVPTQVTACGEATLTSAARCSSLSKSFQK